MELKLKNCRKRFPSSEERLLHNHLSRIEKKCLGNSPLKLCDCLNLENVNILAISIQNAREFVQELFKARERSGRRIMLAENYRGVLGESSDHSVIRLVVDQRGKSEKALQAATYSVDVEPVICARLSNKPGFLGEIAGKLAKAGINIDYIHASALAEAETSIFVIHLPEIDNGLPLFRADR